MNRAHVLADYDRWLDRQALAPTTRAAYRRWVAALIDHLTAHEELDAFMAPRRRRRPPRPAGRLAPRAR